MANVRYRAMLMTLAKAPSTPRTANCPNMPL